MTGAAGESRFQGFRRIDDQYILQEWIPADCFAKLPALAGGADLLRRGRWLTVECRIDIGAEPFHLTLKDGALASFDRSPELMRSTAFTVQGSDEA